MVMYISILVFIQCILNIPLYQHRCYIARKKSSQPYSILFFIHTPGVDP